MLGADLTGSEGYPVYFTATYTDEDITGTDPVTILWDFGDGSTATDTLTPTHTYGDNGIFDVTLTITDSLGSVGSDTLEVSVGNIAPAVDPVPSRHRSDRYPGDHPPDLQRPRLAGYPPGGCRLG